MHYIIMDLEWNGSFCKPLKRYFNEIIEIGAVKLDESLAVVDEFRQLVRPAVSNRLTYIVKQLTHITAEELENGSSFKSAYNAFSKWAGDDFILLTWGRSDLLVMLENCRLFLNMDRISFLKRYVNLQVLCQSKLGDEKGEYLGLSAAAETLGANSEGMELHRALDDSRLSADIFQIIYNEAELQRLLFDADNKEFYDRIEFKNTILKDLSNPLVDKKQLKFRCPECQTSASAPTLKMQKGCQWTFKSRAFRATLVCKRCKKVFNARVQFKLTYDGVELSRSISEITEQQEQNSDKADNPTNP